MKKRPRDSKNEGDKKEGKECSFQFAVLTFVETILAQGDHLTEPHDRMGHPLWVAKNEVKNPTYQQG